MAKLTVTPRERGWTRELAELQADHEGDPARAGMDPCRPSRRGCRRW